MWFCIVIGWREPGGHCKSRWSARIWGESKKNKVLWKRVEISHMHLREDLLEIGNLEGILGTADWSGWTLGSGFLALKVHFLWSNCQAGYNALRSGEWSPDGACSSLPGRTWSQIFESSSYWSSSQCQGLLPLFNQEWFLKAAWISSLDPLTLEDDQGARDFILKWRS